VRCKIAKAAQKEIGRLNRTPGIRGVMGRWKSGIEAGSKEPKFLFVSRC